MKNTIAIKQVSRAIDIYTGGNGDCWEHHSGVSKATIQALINWAVDEINDLAASRQEGETFNRTRHTSLSHFIAINREILNQR